MQYGGIISRLIPAGYRASFLENSMSQVTVFTVAPVIVALIGATKSERQLSAIAHMSESALVASSLMGGKLGKACAAHMGDVTALRFASECAWPSNDYRGLGSFIAGQMAEDVVIGSRATYRSLSDQFEQKIRKVRSAKNGGYRTDNSGLQVPTAALAKLMVLKGLIEDVYAAESQISATRKAEAEAKKNPAVEAS